MCKPFDIKNLSLLETYDPQMLNNQNNKNRNKNNNSNNQCVEWPVIVLENNIIKRKLNKRIENKI